MAKQMEKVNMNSKIGGIFYIYYYQLCRRDCNILIIFSQWASNELQGEATYVNGTEMYKGQWVDNMFHGIGEYIYSDGRIY